MTSCSASRVLIVPTLSTCWLRHVQRYRLLRAFAASRPGNSPRHLQQTTDCRLASCEFFQSREGVTSCVSPARSRCPLHFVAPPQVTPTEPAALAKATLHRRQG